MPGPDGKIRVLSLCGGGIRGVIPSTILRFIEEQTKKPIWQLFDMVCGTSTGGILACGLTKPIPLTASQAVNLYMQRGKEIFASSAWRKVYTLGGNVGPKYDGIGLRNVLRSTFGNTTLESALTPTFVTAYAIEKRAPVFFKSWVPLGSGQPLVDVAMATSAGPTYFPPANVCGDWYCDGGVINNNPALSGTIEACMKYRAHVRDCTVLSLATGFNEAPIKAADAKGWGNLGWVQPLIGIFTDGVSDLTHYQMSDLMPSDQYLALQTPLLEQNSSMDDTDPENLAILVQAAENLLDSNKARLLALCERL